MFSQHFFTVALVALVPLFSLSAADPPDPPLERQLTAAANDPASVAEIARQLLARDPGNVALIERETAARIALGQADLARALLEKWPTDQNGSRRAELSGDLASAEDETERAIKGWIASGSPDALAKAASAQLRESRYADALTTARTLVEKRRDPGDAVLLAQCQALSGDWPGASQQMRELGHRHPDDPAVRAWLPRFERLGPHLAVLAGPAPDAKTLSARAMALLAADWPAAALQPASEGVTRFPGAILPRLLAAHCLRALGREEEAEKLAVMEFRPDQTAKTLREIAPVDHALAVGAEPRPALLARRAELLLQVGQPVLALADAEQSIRTDERSGAGFLAKARALNALGREAEAVGACAVAVNTDPKQPEAWALLGHLRMKRADYRKAAGYFQQALKLADSPDWRARIEDCQRRAPAQ